MRWVKKYLFTSKPPRIRVQQFILNDTDDIAMYEELLTLIATDTEKMLLSEIENWDQYGVLTKLVTYQY